ncbi:MAG: diguanylate cyclase [Eubacterium sp.]|nr:diguanylate cyclase [Eubacterium sp.]
MKSIQTKIITLIIAAIIVSVAAIGGVGVISFEQTINEEVVEHMNLKCREQAQELNNVIGKIQQSVEILSEYALDNVQKIDELKENTGKLQKYISKLEDLGLTIANETQGTLAVYVRFNPEIFSPTDGFFKVKNKENGEFENNAITDFSKYSEDDLEHVGWYYQPVKKGKAMWMLPYQNENIDIYMISYVIPIYKDNTLLGVVGMDIDFHYIEQKIREIKLFETGSAFLTDENFRVLCGADCYDDSLRTELGSEIEKEGLDAVISKGRLYTYLLKGEKRKAALHKLDNDMLLVVTAPASEIYSDRNRFVLQIHMIALILAFVFIFIARLIAKAIIKPLKELNVAAKEIADGNLDVSLDCSSKDEVGTLSKSLEETVKQLKNRIGYINELAYVDTLTDTKNNTAYLETVYEIKEKMQSENIDFAVFVIDVNGLKFINDNYGHDYGNKLLVAASRILTDVFGYEDTFRIGGDEFAVVRMDADREECTRLKMEFMEKIKNPMDGVVLSAAVGSAVFDPNTDGSFESVFKRADGQMYQSKQEMKGSGKSSRIENNSYEIFANGGKA